MTGHIIRSPLANERVWAGFPSVNQTNSNLVAFAGQANRDSKYYNQDINYVWVTDTSTARPRVGPLDRQAPRGPAFLQKFKRAQDGGPPMAGGLHSNPTGPATTSTVRRMPSSFKMRAVIDRLCKLAIAANGTFSIRNGFRQGMTARFS
jgi:hypothetical protein